MGLCKCPKKKVTNLFCFEHRVNVCEHCLVANHPRCVVQSYLQWLQDSDYDPSCPLCQGDLSQDLQNECVRLMCFDVFHWECLNRYAQQLPANTAPAGYVCPKCRGSMFPASNAQSPVADALRSTLSRVNWARSGLGLPLIQETNLSPVSHPSSSSSPEPGHSAVSLPDGGQPSYSRPSAQVSPYTSTPVGVKQLQSHSVVNMESAPQARGADKGHFHEPRRLFDEGSHRSDHDENKYKRRSAFTWLARWFKSRDGNPAHRKPMGRTRKYLMIAFFVFIAVCTLIVIFSRLGAYVTDDDPIFDPHANPHVRIKPEIDDIPDMNVRRL